MDFHESLSCLLDNLERASSPRHAGLGQSRKTNKMPSSGVVVALPRDCRSSLRTARLPAKAYDHAVAPLARF